MRAARALPLAALAGSAYTLLLRPRILNWGATSEDVHGYFPGDEIVAGGKRGGTMAITIDAPPSRVWPWLMQMGCDRGGWYSWDHLDNGGKPSAVNVQPKWQRVTVGDRWASVPSGRAWFMVAALEPARFLALRTSLDVRGRPFEPTGPRPRFYYDSVWCFLLRELPDGRTRLVVSGYATGRPSLLYALAGVLFWEPAHLVMQTRQLAELKWRAELVLMDDDAPGATARSDGMTAPHRQLDEGKQPHLISLDLVREDAEVRAGGRSSAP